MFSVITTALLVATTSFAQMSRSDFDGDGSVGFSDFLLFAGAFGTASAAHDLDASGTVDFGDFLLFVEDYAAENTPPVSSATYLVTFTSTWSESTHPIDFPQVRARKLFSAGWGHTQ